MEVGASLLMVGVIVVVVVVVSTMPCLEVLWWLSCPSG
jgi:hypothetical protein